MLKNPAFVAFAACIDMAEVNPCKCANEGNSPPGDNAWWERWCGDMAICAGEGVSPGIPKCPKEATGIGMVGPNPGNEEENIALRG